MRAARFAALAAAAAFGSYFALVYASARCRWFAFDVGAVAPLFVGLILLNVVLAATPRRWALRRSAFWLYEVVLAIGITALTHALGGIPMGMFLISYALLVIHAQMVRSDASAFVTANACVACYATLAWLEGSGRLPPPPVVAPLDTGQHVVVVITAVLTLNILALYANRYAYELHTLAVHLRDRVVKRTAELTAANLELARAYEELRTTQAQLVETEKRSSLGLLVSGVAHEINNPVSFIVGNVDPLRASLAAVEALAGRHGDLELMQAVSRIHRIADMIARGAERTAAIVGDLRSFSHIGEQPLQRLDVHEAIELTLRLLRPRWLDRIAIHRDYGRVPSIEAAAGRINQVLMNVLANACDAIATHGGIWITTRCDGIELSIAIRDDGQGIPPDDLPRIFDPFFTTKPVGKGTGLGLAISRSIIDDHGGRIAVSTRPGHGTAFTITLPLVAGRRWARRPPELRSPVAELESRERPLAETSSAAIVASPSSHRPSRGRAASGRSTA